MTLDASTLRIDLQEHERWRRTLHVHVPPEVVQREQGRALRKLAGSLKVAGFRKGKAPAAALERRAPAVLRDTLAAIVDLAYRAALDQRSLRPISEGHIEGVEYEPGRGLSFRVTFDVAPVLELSRLDGFRVERPSQRVGAEDVDEALERLLAENALWRPAEDEGPPRMGDLVTLEIERLPDPEAPAPAPTDQNRRQAGPVPVQDVGLPWLRRLRLRADTQLGKRFQLVLGEGDALPRLEQAIAALTPGETREVVVPGDPSDGPGSPLHLRVTLVDRRMRELPELDDAFARSLGDFRSVEDLKRRVRQDLEEEAREAADALLRSRLLDAVLEANPFEVPRSLVERQIDAVLGDTRAVDADTVARARAELAEEAEAVVKRRLLVERIADSEGLSATPHEVRARVEAIAQLGGVTTDQVWMRLDRTNRMEALVQDVTEGKVAAFLTARTEIVEKPDPTAQNGT